MYELIEKLKRIDVVDNKKPFSLLEMLYLKVYGKELVQSEMFAGLLDPYNNHGHGDKLLLFFLRHIDIDVDFKLRKENEINIEIERGVNGRRIDIFISWIDANNSKHAVVIENKLNNAKDQTNQLNDYYDAIIKEGYVVDKIVYMPLCKKWHKSEHTDTRKDVLAKTIDFDAEDIVDFLEKFIEQSDLIEIKHSINKCSVVWQYCEFLKCLISNQYIMQQISEMLGGLKFEEIDNIEKLAELTKTLEWCEVRFSKLVSNIRENKLAKAFSRELLVKYKQNKKNVNYAQFYFENWVKTYWYEIWLYPNDGFYLYKYNEGVYSEGEKFTEMEKLAKHIVPLLDKLSKE